MNPTTRSTNLMIAISPAVDWVQTTGGAPPVTSELLLETGDYVLLETGDKILLES